MEAAATTRPAQLLEIVADLLQSSAAEHKEKENVTAWLAQLPLLSSLLDESKALAVEAMPEKVWRQWLQQLFQLMAHKSPIFRYISLRFFSMTLQEVVSLERLSEILSSKGEMLLTLLPQLLTQADRGRPVPGLRGAAATTLGRLVFKVCSFPQLRHDHLQSLAKAVKALLRPFKSYPPNNAETAEILQALCLCLRSMTTSLRSQLQNIEACCLPLLSSEHPPTRKVVTSTSSRVMTLAMYLSLVLQTQLAATCLTLKTVCGEAEEWRQTVGRVLLSVHTLLDVTLEPDTVKIPQDGPLVYLAYSFSPRANFPMDFARLSRYECLFDGLLQCLQQCLEGHNTAHFPVRAVPIEAIFHLLCRIFALDTTSLSDGYDTTDCLLTQAELRSVLPFLHRHAYKLLSALLRCAHRQLLPLSATIGNLLLQSLQQTTQGPLTSVRPVVHHSIAQCFTILGSGLCPHFAAEILGKLLAELKTCFLQCQVDETTTTLTAQRSKASKKQAVHTTPVAAQPLGQMQYCGADASDASMRSLQPLTEAIYAIVSQGGSLLPHSLRQQLDAVVVSLLSLCNKKERLRHRPTAKQDLSFFASTAYYHALASSPRTRATLYQLLFASVLSPVSGLPTVFPYALDLFTAGSRDPSPRVSALCGQFLRICEVHIHPRVPPSLMPPPIPASSTLSNLIANMTNAATTPVPSSQHSRQPPTILTQQQQSSDQFADLLGGTPPAMSTSESHTSSATTAVTTITFLNTSSQASPKVPIIERETSLSSTTVGSITLPVQQEEEEREEEPSHGMELESTEAAPKVAVPKTTVTNSSTSTANTAKSPQPQPQGHLLEEAEEDEEELPEIVDDDPDSGSGEEEEEEGY
ncbi:hypothetical protein QOT17_010105 [Balamuthia mandrillaris]